MKYIFYNPFEAPSKIKIKSSCFNVDTEYTPFEADNKPVYLEDLLYLSKSDFFDDIQVYLSSHNGAYTKVHKKDLIGTRINGWISLKEVKYGGGYREDFCIELKNEE